MNIPQVASTLPLKTQREYIRVALATVSTAKDGGNADFAGAYICPAVNSLEKQSGNNFSVLTTCNLLIVMLFKTTYYQSRRGRTLLQQLFSF